MRSLGVAAGLLQRCQLFTLMGGEHVLTTEQEPGGLPRREPAPSPRRSMSAASRREESCLQAHHILVHAGVRSSISLVTELAPELRAVPAAFIPALLDVLLKRIDRTRGSPADLSFGKATCCDPAIRRPFPDPDLSGCLLDRDTSVPQRHQLIVAFLPLCPACLLPVPLCS